MAGNDGRRPPRGPWRHPGAGGPTGGAVRIPTGSGRAAPPRPVGGGDAPDAPGTLDDVALPPPGRGRTTNQVEDERGGEGPHRG